MPKREEVHVGMMVGKWEVLDRTEGDMWAVMCECGKAKEIKESTLKYGRTGGCKACANRKRREDLIGKDFGDWRVIDDGEGDESLCKCRCGRVSWVNRYSLTSGISTKCKSCRGRFSRVPQKRYVPRDNELPMDGRKRYKWKIIERDASLGSDQCHYYKCECIKCGSQQSVKYGTFKGTPCLKCFGVSR